MGFSFTINEKEYVSSGIAHVESHTSSKVGLGLYCILAAISLHLVIMITYGQISRPEPKYLGFYSVVFLASIGIIVVPALWRIVWVPSRFSRAYRGLPELQSEMRVTITPRGFTRDSDVGAPMRANWEQFHYWQEFRKIVILVDGSDNWRFTAMRISSLPDWQQEQLRELLSAFLPRK